MSTQSDEIAPNSHQSSFLSGKLPQPSESYEKNVICLRGKLVKEGDQEQAFNDPHQLLGNENVVHSITGMWSAGLDFLLSDPDNTRGLCNRFEYEHKSSSPNASFPVSGRYSGWFDLNNEEGGKTKFSEDITLRFRKNNAGYHNVEGKGSNAFGKYTITGTLTKDNVVTIFRHFLVKKVKSSANSPSGSNSKLVTSAPPPISRPPTNNDNARKKQKVKNTSNNDDTDDISLFLDLGVAASESTTPTTSNDDDDGIDEDIANLKISGTAKVAATPIEICDDNDNDDIESAKLAAAANTTTNYIHDYLLSGHIMMAYDDCNLDDDDDEVA